MKNTILTLALALVVSNANAGTSSAKNPPVAPAPAPAPACNTLSYDFVEASYLHSFSGDGADGYGVAFNKSLTGNLFAFGDYNQYFSPDVWDIGAGLGYHHALTSCIDWVVKAGVLYEESELYGDSFNGNVGTGFRIGLANWLQLDVFYHGFWSEFEDYSNSGSAALIFREIIAPKVDLIVSGSVGEDDYQSMSAGIRYNF